MRWSPFRRRDGQELRPTPGELQAAEEAVRLFATESLLALHAYERSIPDAVRPQRTRARFEAWWRSLKLDEVELVPRERPPAGPGRAPEGRPDVPPPAKQGSEPEQILEMAGELALDKTNVWGLSVEAAAAEAQRQAANEAEHRAAWELERWTSLEDQAPSGQWDIPLRGIEEFQKDFADSYGGRVQVPDDPDRWLGESLTRLSRAAMLRDVLALGAQVKVGEPARAAAGELAREGQRLMDNRDQLAQKQAQQPPREHSSLSRLAGINGAYFTWITAVHAAGVPPVAQVALKTPAVALLIYGSLRNVTLSRKSDDRREAYDRRLEPVQEKLQAVRTDLINTVDAAEISSSDTRKVNRQRAADRRRSGGRDR